MLRTTETFIGESLEEKLRRIDESGEPVEAISPMIYTERKDGVIPAYDIRADKWDNAMMQMDKMTLEHRQGRAERIMDTLMQKEPTPAEKNPQTEV